MALEISKGYSSLSFLSLMLGYTCVKIESQEAAVLANRSSEPTKFLFSESRYALLIKERLTIWCTC